MLFFVLVPLSCLAQSGAGEAAIAGTVFDPAGAIVRGVTVTAQNVGTRLTRTVTSDQNGRYTLGSLQPGEYELTFEAPGFARLLQKGISLLTGQSATVDAKLQVSGAQETITVNADVSVVELNKTEQSSYITSQEIDMMPLNGRRWDNLVMLTPATSADGTYGLVSYRGISGLYNNNMIDGADNNQAFFSEARGRTRLNYTISQAAIQEFQVGTSNYSAEFGRAAGGTVNAVTKSGTNEIHGEGFYFIRDQSMNATNPTLKTNSILIANNFTKPPDRRQQFGGAIGGPIVKNKFFYFLSYDQQKRNFPAAVLPSSSTFLTTAAPSSGAAPNYAAAISFFSTLVMTQDRQGNQQVGLAKTDWQITPNHRLSTTFNIMRWDSPNGIQTGVNHAYDVSANGTDGVKNEYIITRLNSVLRPTLINEFRFQYGRDFEFQTANGTGPNLGITGGITVEIPITCLGRLIPMKSSSSGLTIFPGPKAATT